MCFVGVKETHGEVGHDDFSNLKGELTSVGLRRDWNSTHEVEVLVSRPLSSKFGKEMALLEAYMRTYHNAEIDLVGVQSEGVIRPLDPVGQVTAGCNVHDRTSDRKSVV